MKDHFCIDVFKKSPEIMLYEAADIQADMRDRGAKSVSELSDFDRVIFKTLDDAQYFELKYNEAKAKLLSGKTCESRELPAIRMKRHYMILALMGYKTKTNRAKPLSIFSKLRPGDYFNLHDQTYFVTCRFSKYTLRTDGRHEYHFHLPR